MILAAACRVTIVAMLLSLSVEARADVLELNADGARWVAGPLAGQSLATPAAVDPEAASSVPLNAADVDFAEAPSIPEHAIADPARHAALIEMTNLIGDDVDDWQSLAREAGTFLHLYGKHDARKGRKMGHVNRIKNR